MDRNGSYTAIVIAAGLSSRMGEFKPLMDIGGRPALFRLLDGIREAGIERGVIVTGYRRETIEAALKERDDGQDNGDGSFCLETVYNPDYENGMFSSIQAGLRRLSEIKSGQHGDGFRYPAHCPEAVLLFPVDVPLVPAETIVGLIGAWEQSTANAYFDSLAGVTYPSTRDSESGGGNAANTANTAKHPAAPFAVPVCKGKNGHPLLIPREYFDEILGYDGEGGLKAVRSRYDAGMVKYITDDEGCVLDIDTPEDYRKLLEYFKKGSEGKEQVMSGETNNQHNGDGSFCVVRPRIFLVRHGQPVQHSGKIFLGQADIPLSDRGKDEAEAAATRLSALGARPKRIYSSDLLRAKETADIIAARLGGVPVVTDILLREMAMGTWDGELIEDIKAKFPGEYEKRGDDPRNYRTPGGENFYELRGRVTREFHRIFAEDFRKPKEPKGDGSCGSPAPKGDGSNASPGDLVIVAHLGVLVALSEELLSASPGVEHFSGFPTGSVTLYDIPEWLWNENED